MLPFEYLGPYKVVKIIGRGGMGSVYEAEHVKSGERVAIKVISHAFADEPRFRRRFDGEVETLKRLRHRGIVSLLGVGEEEGHLFYVMELVDGEPLQQRIRREKKLSWQTTIDIAIDVCSALKHAHDIGAVHRDLKPANLILTNDGSVKLIDFGITKLFGYGDQTVPGSVLGTADYMAPEQAGSGPITPRTDLYSLGCVMYAMLAGRAPFTGKRMTEVIEALKRDRPVPLDMIDPDLPEALVELVHELLEKAPEDRPPTALSVMKRLRSMKAGLYREQTSAQSSSPTRSDHEATPVRGNGIEEDGTVELTGESSVLTGMPSDERTFSDNPPTVRTSQRSGAVYRQASPDDLTIASVEARREKTAESTVVPPAKQEPKRTTRFETIDTARTASTVFESGLAHEDSHWLQWISIAAMVLILLGGAGLFVWAVRTPSADVLHERLLEADRNGDLLSERAIIKQFLDNYPSDPRYESVQALSESIEVENYLRQLRTEANRIGGTERLEPAKQAFLDAMGLRNRRPDAAIVTLTQWLVVFEHDAKSDLAIRRMSVYTHHELERLRSLKEESFEADSRVQDLLSRIEWSQDNLSGDQRREFLSSMIQLYKQDDWAKPALQTAKEALQSLASPTSETGTPTTGS